MPPKFKRHLHDDELTGSVRSERRNLLEEDSDEEEDFFLRGPSGSRFGPRNDKIRHVQNQVDEVIDVMQENITKVIERGERLDDLQDKSGATLRAALLSVCPFPHISSPLLGRAPCFHLTTRCLMTDLGLYLCLGLQI
uniref:Vesicle associated membrane protein 4 n=1 Tax=Cairina moschata TaxID=8855 RepID=A0A8C3B458_CAIMO